MTPMKIKDDKIKKIGTVLNLLPKYKGIKKAHLSMGF